MIYTDMNDMPEGGYGVIYADPATHFRPYSKKGNARSPQNHYMTMSIDAIAALPVERIAAKNCVLFLWVTAPLLFQNEKVFTSWGFRYSTIGFSWLKANASQMDIFRDDLNVEMKMGFWTRSNGEICLLCVRGKPKRLKADVRMGIIEPAREHSRKPDCVYPRVERLVAGPYVELFGRNERPGWDVWGNQVGKFKEVTK